MIQAKGIPGEVGGHPIQNDAYPGLMQAVDEPAQIIGGAKAAGGGEITCHLIAPGGIQGVLHHGKQLYMGEAHLLYIGDQPVAYRLVAEEFPLPCSAPGAKMALINIEGLLTGGIFLPPVQPGLIPPGIVGQVVEFGGHLRAGIRMKSVGVGLAHIPSVAVVDRELIPVVLMQPGDKNLPDATLKPLHRCFVDVPAVEVPQQRDQRRIGRPDPEEPAIGPALVPGGVGPHALPGPEGAPLRECLQFQV